MLSAFTKLKHVKLLSHVTFSMTKYYWYMVAMPYKAYPVGLALVQKLVDVSTAPGE